MAVITRLEAPRATYDFTPLARLGVGAIALLAATIVGAAAGMGLSQTALILGVFAPFVLVAALARPQWAAVVYLALVYGDLLSIMVQYDGLPSLSRFVGVGLLCTALGYRLFVERRPLARDQVTFWMLAYGAVVALGLLYARAPSVVMGDVIEFVRNFLTYLIVINIITTSPRLHAALYTILAVGTALASLTLFQSVTGTFDNDYGGLAQYRVSDITSSTEGARPGGSLGDANYYGQLLLVLVPIALYLMFEGRSRASRLVGAASACIISTAVILTYSRGDAIALGVIIVAALIYKKPNPLWILAGLAAVVVTVPLLLPNYVARMATVLDLASGDQQIYNQDDSILGRTGATEAAIAMFLDHPILGVGRENYPLYQLEYLAGTPYARIANGIPPHDLYLEVAAENGAVGIIVFGGFLLATLAALRDAWKRFRRAGLTRDKELTVWLAIMLIGYLISALSLHGAYLYILWLQVSVIVAARQIATNYEPRIMNYGLAPRSTGLSMPADRLPNSAARSFAGLSSFAQRAASGLHAITARTAAFAAGPFTQSGHRRVIGAPQDPVLTGYIVADGRRADVIHAEARAEGYELLPADEPPGSANQWLAAAEDALSRGDVKTARALVDIALEQNPYDIEAWAVRMSVRMAEEQPVEHVLAGYVTANRTARRAFLQANGTTQPDYYVDDKLFDYWHANGGVPIFGNPISPYFAEMDASQNMVEVQYFERARLEYRPEHKGSASIIVPGKLGLEVPVRGVVALQLPAGLEGEQLLFTARGMGMPTPRKFFAFWERNGGPDIFGYPISPLLIDAGDNGSPLAVQYFDKARLEYHPQFAGTAHEVQVTRLGAELFAHRYAHKMRTLTRQ